VYSSVNVIPDNFILDTEHKSNKTIKYYIINLLAKMLSYNSTMTWNVDISFKFIENCWYWSL